MKIYQEIKTRLDDLSNEELQALMAAASATIDKRKDFRKKELWGNVVAAICKYEKEIEPIQVLIPRVDDTASISNLDYPGGIVVNYD